MYVEQLYTGCLAEAAYYIESNGEAAVIDPIRETVPYTELAESRGAKIKYVFETHFHADFVSGHIDLAKTTGAKIVFGPNAKPSYEALVAEDNQVFKIGDITITALHTPGHTMESTTYLLKDEKGEDKAIFTGDTLFLGDVGRPDLAVKSDLTEEDLAGHLFDSLRNKIMPLADDVTVYPGHGAGSACGKNMSKETVGTLGDQKQNNYALRADMTKEEFIKEVTNGLQAPPQYFPKNVMLNKNGYENIDEVLSTSNKALSLQEFELASEREDILILDVRNQFEFVKGFVPGSWFIGLNGQFATWAGALVDELNKPLLLICPEGKELEAITRLARVGFDNVIGYLEGGFETWKNAEKPIQTIESIDTEELKKRMDSSDINLLDVRKESEFKSEHVNIKNISNTPLDFIHERVHEVNPEKEYYVQCLGGYRSVIATSILMSKGYTNLIDVAGGFGAIKKTDGIPLTEYVCPTTL